ncbi:hypothetical protein K0M31_017161 [Melipona bicolor]|uniref:Uncharacterized protein n=1 Tax=Melipona bicolor TaxID=60889 RepID=A0AA40KS65_9HYME|nr:hypothetical protein K0M31_017161 [Melipona bicolor]
MDLSPGLNAEEQLVVVVSVLSVELLQQIRAGLDTQRRQGKKYSLAKNTRITFAKRKAPLIRRCPKFGKSEYLRISEFNCLQNKPQSNLAASYQKTKMGETRERRIRIAEFQHRSVDGRGHGAGL